MKGACDSTPLPRNTTASRFLSPEASISREKKKEKRKKKKEIFAKDKEKKRNE